MIKRQHDLHSSTKSWAWCKCFLVFVHSYTVCIKWFSIHSRLNSSISVNYCLSLKYLILHSILPVCVCSIRMCVGHINTHYHTLGLMDEVYCVCLNHIVSVSVLFWMCEFHSIMRSKRWLRRASSIVCRLRGLVCVCAYVWVWIEVFHYQAQLRVYTEERRKRRWIRHWYMVCSSCWLFIHVWMELKSFIRKRSKSVSYSGDE